MLPEAPDPKWGTPEDVQRFIEVTAGQVKRGQLDANVGSVLLRAADSWMKVYESQQIRAQLEALEQLAGAKLQRTWG